MQGVSYRGPLPYAHHLFFLCIPMGSAGHAITTPLDGGGDGGGPFERIEIYLFLGDTRIPRSVGSWGGSPPPRSVASGMLLGPKSRKRQLLTPKRIFPKFTNFQ